jgi:hypothetical protein
MELPEILSYNVIAWNSFSIMWLPEILLYNGFAWNSANPLYKRIWIQSFYTYHTFSWVLMKSVIQSVSQ